MAKVHLPLMASSQSRQCTGQAPLPVDLPCGGREVRSVIYRTFLMLFLELRCDGQCEWLFACILPCDKLASHPRASSEKTARIGFNMASFKLHDLLT